MKHDRATDNLTLVEAFMACPRPDRCRKQCPFREGWQMSMGERLETIERFSDSEADALARQARECGKKMRQ